MVLAVLLEGMRWPQLVGFDVPGLEFDVVVELDYGDRRAVR